MCDQRSTDNEESTMIKQTWQGKLWRRFAGWRAQRHYKLYVEWQDNCDTYDHWTKS